MLKRASGPLHEWWAEAMVGVVADGFRLATPVRTRPGAWSHEGWSATRWVDGREADHTQVPAWLEIIETGRAFHAAVAHLTRPAQLDSREDWWARADRSAWGEQVIRFRPELADLGRRLQGALEPLGRPQLVHGDLTSNVLFSPESPPAVIDISPYWRPRAFAEGVVVADALCWHDAPPSVLQLAAVPVAAVARALIFRLATTQYAVMDAPESVDLADEARRYGLAVTAIGC